MYINNFENNINSNNNINNSNNINNNIYNSNSNNIPIFWAIITTQKLRFIYLSPSLKSLIYKKDNNLNFLIGSSIYDYISQNDIKQIKFHIHSYINSGEFIDKKFRIRVANFREMAEKYEQHPNLSKKQILEEVNYISCDLLLNVISEFNTLAFFYPYPVYLKDVPYKWYATEIDELWFRIIEQMKIRENTDNLEPFQQLSKLDSLNTRAMQILDTNNMSLIYSIPKQRMSKLLGQEISIMYNVPNFPKKFYPPEDYDYFDKKMKNYLDSKLNNNESANNSDSNLQRFYFDHRIFHFVPKDPGNHRFSQMIQFPDEKAIQESGTFQYIPVKSLVVPYGKIIIIITQTVNFFEGDNKNKLTSEIERINDKSPFHVQSSTPIYILSSKSDEIKSKNEEKIHIDNKNSKSTSFQQDINGYSDYLPIVNNISVSKGPINKDNNLQRNNKNNKQNIEYMDNNNYYKKSNTDNKFRYNNGIGNRNIIIQSSSQSINKNISLEDKQKPNKSKSFQSKHVSLPSINQLTNSLESNKHYTNSFDPISNNYDNGYNPNNNLNSNNYSN
ncbi:hypothetical protein LY90DRAFT_666578, partial [Neocallimastix californiae]